LPRVARWRVRTGESRVEGGNATERQRNRSEGGTVLAVKPGGTVLSVKAEHPVRQRNSPERQGWIPCLERGTVLSARLNIL
jgi:hypothetical protein